VHASTDLRLIPQSVGITTLRVDGVDTSAVHFAVADAASRCRAGKGPVFIEAMTPRWAGSNPLWPELATGITDIRMALGEVPGEGPHQQWYEHFDPLLRLAREIAAGGPDNAHRIRSLDAMTLATIAKAGDFAVNSPLPAPETALDNVFAREVA